MDDAHHGAFFAAHHGSQRGGSAGRAGAGRAGRDAHHVLPVLRHAASMGPTVGATANEMVPSSQYSSTATSDTSQQQPSRLGSNMSLGPRQGSRLMVNVDARPTSK
jgi:hypothetical protein